MADSYNNTLYSSNCDKCWEEVRIKTQEDRHPEYYTTVYVECNTCLQGEAQFKLPVN